MELLQSNKNNEFFMLAIAQKSVTRCLVYADGIGYFLSSEVKKDTQFGSWKANGEPCEIFTNSVLTGWRTTFEFFEGLSPNEKKTNWVMQEYRITLKGMGDGSKAKVYNQPEMLLLRPILLFKSLCCCLSVVN